jgi:predicted DNA-binding WGR domain protein
MQPVHLHRVNAEANMARFYHIDIAPTLFGEVSVLRSWGRIGTHGRTSIETCVTPEEAESAASRARVKRSGAATSRNFGCAWLTYQAEISQALLCSLPSSSAPASTAIRS